MPPLRPELSTSGVNQQSVGVLAKLYTDAADRLKTMVLKPTGSTESSQQFKKMRASQLIRDIDLMLIELKGHTHTWANVQVPAAFTDGLARAEKQAKDLGVEIPDQALKGSFAKIDHGAVKVFADAIAGDLGGAAKMAGDRAKSVLRKTAQLNLEESEINTILAGGLIEGKPAETIRKLRDRFREVGDGTVQVKDKNGKIINFEAGYYASMVARSQTRQASVHSRHERLQSLDLDLVSIVGLISTHFCTAFLGQVFSLSGKSSKYPAYSQLPGGGPPFHPNCSKSTRPFVEELASPLQLDQAEGLDDAQKLLGDDITQAQRKFKDLQLHTQQKDRYATTAKKLFGRAA